jgi:hypothetical protein
VHGRLPANLAGTLGDKREATLQLLDAASHDRPPFADQVERDLSMMGLTAVLEQKHALPATEQELALDATGSVDYTITDCFVPEASPIRRAPSSRSGEAVSI